LQLLNLLVAAVDSLAQQASQQRAEAMEQMYSDAAGSNEPAASLLGQLHEPTSTHHSPNRRASFATLWLQFEQTLELLRQVYKSSVVSQWTGSGAPPHIGAGTNGAPSWPSRPLVAGGQTLGAPAPIDTRFLLFIVGEYKGACGKRALSSSSGSPKGASLCWLLFLCAQKRHTKRPLPTRSVLASWPSSLRLSAVEKATFWLLDKLKRGAS